MMIELIKDFGLPVLTAVLGWLGSKWQTSREAKQSDIKLINEAINPLLLSISELTKTLQDTNGKLIEEQQKNLQLTVERNTLANKIEKLTKQINELKQALDKLTKTDV